MNDDYAFFPRVPKVVQFAEEILAMHDRNERLERENAELRDYRQKYMDLLDKDIKHDRQILSGLLQVSMTPGVPDAITKHNEEAK